MGFRISGGKYYDPLTSAFRVGGSTPLVVKAVAAQLRHSAAAGGQLAFAAASYSAPEGTILTFGVNRLSGAAGTVAVDWAFTGLTEGAPLVPNGTISWNNSEAGLKQVNVQLTSVTVDRAGSIVLSNPRAVGGGAAPTIAPGGGTAAATVTDAAPLWDGGTLTVELTQGVAVPAGVLADLVDNGGELTVFSDAPSQDAPPGGFTAGLPPGVIITSAGLSGTPSAFGSYARTIRAADSIDVVADWLARSGQPGVFYKHNNSWRNAAQTLPITNDAELRQSSWGGAVTGGTASAMVRDTVNKLSGPCGCKLMMRAANPGEYTGFGIGWDGIGVNTKNTIKHEFYLQWIVYFDQVYRDFFFGPNGTWGGKLCIIEAPNRSFDPGEVVFRRWAPGGGFFKGYRIPGFGASAGSSLDFALAYNSLGPDYAFNNFIDRGGSVTNQNTLQLKHGPNYGTGGSAEGVTIANDPDYQHAPRMVANGWTVMTAYVNQNLGIVKLWTSPYGSPPELTLGSMAARLPLPGALDSQGMQLYTGAQLTNYPNTASFWPVLDTFWTIGEIIASNNPINHPGGYALPHSGIIVPPNYVPSGAVEQ